MDLSQYSAPLFTSMSCCMKHAELTLEIANLISQSKWPAGKGLLEYKWIFKLVLQANKMYKHLKKSSLSLRRKYLGIDNYILFARVQLCTRKYWFYNRERLRPLEESVIKNDVWFNKMDGWKEGLDRVVSEEKKKQSKAEYF